LATVERPPICRARARQQGYGKRLDGGWLKAADAKPGAPCLPKRSRWRPRPHSSRTEFDFRTVPAHPHNPAQVFLPIIAQRCKIMLAIRGKHLYLGVQVNVKKGKYEQQ
jgi:hypothetical protein